MRRKKYNALSKVMKDYIRESLGRSQQSRLSSEDLLKVRSIIFTGGGMSDVRGLQRCKNLTSLRMHNGVADDLTSLKDLPLKHIDLFSNKIKNIEPLKNITSLQYLNISQNNQIRNYTPLCYLKNLVHLYADIPFHQSYVIKSLPNLKTFNGRPFILKRYVWSDDIFIVALAGGNITAMEVPSGISITTHMLTHSGHAKQYQLLPRTSYIKYVTLTDAITIIEEMLMTSGLDATRKMIQTEFVTSCPEDFNLGMDEHLIGTEMEELEDKDDIFRGL